MKIIFLGAPGAGKGTQAENTALIYGIPTISTGAIIRESIKAGTEAGKSASAYIAAGALVPDEVVIGIIKERLALPDCAGGFILDGFPRTLSQAAALDGLGIEIDLAVNIEVPDEEIIARMSGRRVCGKCGATYHISYYPSKREGECDKCGGGLKTRSDDLPEVVKKRLEVYHEQTAPLKNYYASRNKLKTVVGQIQIADTTRLTLAAISEALGAKASMADGVAKKEDGQ